MSKYFLLLMAATLSLSLVLSAEEPVVAGIPTSQAIGASGNVAIHDLRRRGESTEPPSVAARDPFMSTTPTMPLENDLPDYSSPAVAHTTPKFADFRVLGKQRDDNGWAVFIGETSDQGTVWVVRTGDSFDEHYRVSKLAPPVLVIKNSRNGKSKTFDIGKDEE